MNDRPILSVNEIITTFGQTTVHRGITFEVKRATVTALIGGSGSGKSVLLREVVGLLPPTSGTVHLLGVDVWGDPEGLEEIRSRFGILYQQGALFSSLTVEQNISAPLVEFTALPASTISEIAALRLALAGLDASALPKSPSALSGGMRKRVALARALALEPEILFLDEPTSGLDPIGARNFDTLVRTLCDNLGLTIFIVTHDIDTLYSIVDTVIVLADGVVHALGPVRDVARIDDPWIREYFSSRVSEPSSKR
jgi:phospholipid/cholesterol/gamma-HCH transport system ATP-binding protein